MPFNNSILGGVGNLIRQYIRSPNYVPGVSGWTINKDGSVEFNSGTFRGTITNGGMFIYDGTPALGTLILAVAAAAGQDSFGNGYGQGLTLPAEAGSLTSSPLAFKVAGALNAASYIASIIGVSGGAPNLQIQANNGAAIWLNTDNSAGSGYKIGNGAQLYRPYKETVQFSAQTIASSTAASTINNLASQFLQNDWSAGGFDLPSGIWTCPATGMYLWSSSVQFAAWVAGSRLIHFASVNGTVNTAAFMSHDNFQDAGAAKCTISAVLPFNKNDTVALRVAQATGAGQTLDTTVPRMNLASVVMLP